MAIRPKRKAPISTRPIYLPKVRAKELLETAAAGAPAEESPCLRILVDGSSASMDIETLTQRLGRAAGLRASFGGELVAVLVGRRHSEARDAVATLANRIAWARIRDPDMHDYRVLPLRGEVDQEEARFRARSRPEYEGLEIPVSAADALYDGAQVQAAYRDLLPEDDGGATYVVVTDRRVASWNAKAKRWIASAVLRGSPIVASVSSEEGPTDARILVDGVGHALKNAGRKARSS